MDYTKIKEAAQAYLPAMTKFLRDLIAIPSESCEEEGVVKRTIAEMEALGFDKAEIDPEGNALGWMGTGDKIIAFDGHIDTVGIGNIANWEHDPYEGYETDDIIYGRGGSDQEGGVVSAVYGAKIMKDRDLIPEGYKILVVASVRRRTATVSAGSTSIRKTASPPSSWSPPSPPTAASIAAIGAAWRSG